MKYEQIHETVIRDIIDVAVGVKNADSLQSVFAKDKTNYSSIASKSSGLTLVFPVLVTKSMNVENAAMVCKAIERKAVTMLQMLFSATCITSAKDGFDFITSHHTNMKFDSDLSVDEFIDAVDKYAVEHEQATGEPFILNRELYDAVKEDMKHIGHYIPPVVSEHSINDFVIHSDARMGGKNVMIRESLEKRASDITTAMKNTAEYRTKQILPTDVKKANELVPSMMIVHFVSTSSGTPTAADVVIGVKAKMYVIDSADVVQRLSLKNKDNNGFGNFIRATTREISFWKDFVFAVDRAKVDALSSSGRGSSSKIWKLLERRALKSKVRRTLGMNNDATAITSLVITQNEVEYLKKNDNIDIEKPAITKSIMSAYNLMTFVIVDEAQEIVKFLFDDGDNMFETLTFNHLERETSDGGYKKVVNLMTKMAR